MPITLNGSTGITTPGQTNTANETITEVVTAIGSDGTVSCPVRIAVI